MRIRTPSPTVTRSVARRTRRGALAALALLLACDANPFDSAQVPRITVTPVVAVPLVMISWVPAGAASVRVYRGASAGDGYGPELWWSVIATSGNSLTSGVEYGATTPAGGSLDVAAKPLVPGQPYTVEVRRLDPKGRGDGFTGTGNRYVNTQTFTLPTALPAP